MRFLKQFHFFGLKAVCFLRQIRQKVLFLFDMSLINLLF